MSLVVTGATGPFGRHVVESLLARGVPAGTLVAGGRRVDTLADLAAQGVRTVRLDYDDEASIAEAVKDADKVLIVSGTDFGQRVRQHTAVATAARDTGARAVLYTSAPYADRTSLQLAAEHRATEQAIAALGVPFTFLRNGWYFENYLAQLPTYLEHGVVGSAGDGRISGAPRAELAEAAAVVLAGDGHDGAIYELGGDTSFSLPELAATVARHTGQDVGYTDLPVEEFAAVLERAGLPAPVAALFADTDRAIRAGDLEITTGDLGRLLGRPTTTLDAAVAAAVA